MEAPFVYGRIADDLNFTDRKNEVALLTQNFKNLINTVIISPRRWGKTSLVNKCAKLLSEENKNTLVCQVDIFNCRTEEQFYTAYANALIRVNINEYEDSLAFQRKLRAHWQTHTSVCYCLYGSKRHMLLSIFNDYSMPFYKFGDILFLQKIERKDWVAFISQRFADTGKQISDELSGMIADKMKNHPYYTQQLSQQTWLRTSKECSEAIVNEAFNSLIGQLSLLFTNIIDSLTSRQISFLIAVADGVVNFSSKDILKHYQLGTSANIKNLKKATLEKDLIDILPCNTIEIQDPAFEYWLKNVYQNPAR